MMTLRDYLAAKAMAAMIVVDNSDEGIDQDELAADSYIYADAMLAARKK